MLNETIDNPYTLPAYPMVASLQQPMEEQKVPGNPYATRPGYKPRPLFLDSSGQVYDARTIADELRSRGLSNLRGKPLVVQLSALGIYETFLNGSTPWQLPYSIWS